VGRDIAFFQLNLATGGIPARTSATAGFPQATVELVGLLDDAMEPANRL
jgi:hypothetical protein